MSTPHTPGPWGCTYTSNYAHDYRLTRSNGLPLHVDAPFNDHSIQRANAQLIACAPELLAALQRMLKEGYLDPRLLCVLQANQVITKATGEEP
jgi:hypothetical protein